MRWDATAPADDRAFAAVARLSDINLSLYRTFMQPLVRALANQPSADIMRTLDPLRLSYTLFSDRNPWMRPVQKLAAEAAAARKPVPADNPFLALQTQISDQITAGLDAYRVQRDQMAEKMFFAFYGSPFIQALLGVDADSVAAAGSRPFVRRSCGAPRQVGRIRGHAEDRRLR